MRLAIGRPHCLSLASALISGLTNLPRPCASQELLERGQSRIVAVADRKIEPGEAHLHVRRADRGRTPPGAHRAAALGSLRGSRLRKRSRSSVFQLAQAAGGAEPEAKAAAAWSCSANVSAGGRAMLERDAGLIDPAVEHQLVFERLVALDQMLADVGEEHRRRDRLEGVAVEPALEPRVEPVAADIGLDRAQERRALFISDVAQPIVGMAAGKVEVEPGVGPGRPAVFGDRLVELVDAERASARRPPSCRRAPRRSALRRRWSCPR